MCRMSWKSGSLNLLEPSGPHRACYGTALSLLLHVYTCAGGKIEKNEMGGACGAYGAGERNVQGSGGET